MILFSHILLSYFSILDQYEMNTLGIEMRSASIIYIR